jgi:hypothetical protein
MLLLLDDDAGLGPETCWLFDSSPPQPVGNNKTPRPVGAAGQALSHTHRPMCPVSCAEYSTMIYPARLSMLIDDGMNRIAAGSTNGVMG